MATEALDAAPPLHEDPPVFWKSSRVWRALTPVMRRIYLWQVACADVVMFGDSLTEDGRWLSRFPSVRVANLGIGGDTTHAVRARLEKVRRVNPSAVFLLVGINDLLRGADAGDLLAQYDRIVERLVEGLPAARLFLQSVLPTTPAWSIGLAELAPVNEGIAQSAARHGASFIDLAPLFAGPDGYLRPELTTDGLHLSEQGYAVWCSAIDPHVSSRPRQA